MDLNPVFNAIGRDDQSWLGSARGTSSAQSVALAMSAFTAGTHYPNGYFPSGLPIALYTSGGNSGKYGPYTTGAADGSQTLAGFILTATAAPRATGSTVVNAAMLDTGRIISANLPLPVDAAGKTSNPRFVYA